MVMKVIMHVQLGLRKPSNQIGLKCQKVALNGMNVK